MRAVFLYLILFLSLAGAELHAQPSSGKLETGYHACMSFPLNPGTGHFSTCSDFPELNFVLTCDELNDSGSEHDPELFHTVISSFDSLIKNVEASATGSFTCKPCTPADRVALMNFRI